MSRCLRLAAAVVCAIALLCAAGSGAPATEHASRLAPFFARVRGAGRAQVQIERRTRSALAEGEQVTRGRVTLEPPARARVDFEGGECVTVRDDGGEWLQPAFRQLVKLGPERARGALGWCDLLLGDRAGAIRSHDLADGRVLLVRAEGPNAADSAWASLDASGQPTVLEFRAASGELERTRLTHWSFSAARGRAAFVLTAPHGFEIVDLP
ncbi:MAG: LolA family protein [Gaiellaceae bacterium]